MKKQLVKCVTVGLLGYLPACGQQKPSHLNPATHARTDALVQEFYNDSVSKAFIVLGEPLVDFKNSMQASDTAIFVLDPSHKIEYQPGEGPQRTGFTGMAASAFSTDATSRQVLISDQREWDSDTRRDRREVKSTNYYHVPSEDRVGEVIRIIQTGVIEELTIKLVEGREVDAAYLTDLLERLRALKEGSPESFPKNLNVELYFNDKSIDRGASKFLLAHDSLRNTFAFANFKFLLPNAETSVYENFNANSSELNKLRTELKAEVSKSAWYRNNLRSANNTPVFARLANRELELRFKNDAVSRTLEFAEITWADGRKKTPGIISENGYQVIREKMFDSDFNVTLKLKETDKYSDSENIRIQGKDIAEQSSPIAAESQVPKELANFVTRMEATARNAEFRLSIGAEMGEMAINRAIHNNLINRLAVGQVQIGKGEVWSDYYVGSERVEVSTSELNEKLEKLKPTFERITAEHERNQKRWLKSVYERVIKPKA